MLVFKRKQGQSIQIGPNIRITVHETHKSVVKITVDAPKDISVLRSELLDVPANTNTKKEEEK